MKRISLTMITVQRVFPDLSQTDNGRFVYIYMYLVLSLQSSFG